MTAKPFDHESLWLKAKSFINRSFAAADTGDFDEAALWASCALELLGKAALSKVSPLLVADPSDDGKSLLIAAGLSSDFAGFKSIQAKAVFSRCARAFPPFSELRANQIAVNRNEELHSGGLPFAAVHQDVWWQTFWALATVLAQARDRTLDELVPANRVKTVEEHLARNAENIKLRVESLIQRATQRLQLLDAAVLTAQVHAELSARAAAISLEHLASHRCPACGGIGFLHGDYVGESDVQYDYEDATATETLTVLVESFSCENCGLVLPEQEFIAVAELPDTFIVEREYEPEYDDYGNE
ncbi:MAG: hypothetical protein KY458_03365 [Actinobacteria bacterium]|nr:hypothetical protein [Actinomycetota bacterium]